VSTVDANRSHNWFVRAAAVIGDLSNPFYREERQRDVWNEASAVALQVLIWLHLLAATAAVWFVGADAVPYVYALIAMVGLAGWIAILYSWSLGVRVETSTTSRRRLVPLVLVAVLLAAGLVRATTVDFSVDGWSTVAGMVTGAAAVLVPLAVLARYARRRTQAGGED
jgi:hypothetical protein